MGGIFMFYRERKDFYRVYADNKEEAQKKLDEALDKEMENPEVTEEKENEYYDGSETAMDFTFSHQLDETHGGKYFK
jgi:hypothetical protein